MNAPNPSEKAPPVELSAAERRVIERAARDANAPPAPKRKTRPAWMMFTWIQW